MVNGTIIYDSYGDSFGYQTPETLAAEMLKSDDSYIIFDLNTNKTIDVIGAALHFADYYNPTVNEIYN